MQMKCKKRGMTGTAIKNKDQVRFFYYRTWNKISKFISVQGSKHLCVQRLGVNRQKGRGIQISWYIAGHTCLYHTVKPTLLSFSDCFVFSKFLAVLHNWYLKSYDLYCFVSEESLYKRLKVGTCARDRRALQQLALNVQVKHCYSYGSEMQLRGKSVHSWCNGSSDRSFLGWTHSAISRSSQCSTTGVTNAVVCIILSVGWCI